MGTRRDYRMGAILLLALLACAGLLWQHRRAERAGRPDPVLNAIHTALTPAQSGVTGIGRWWRTHVVSLFEGPRLARENADLQRQVQTLAAENRDLHDAQAENDRLRRLLAFERRSPRRLLAAQVAALKPSLLTDTLILNRGQRDGVRLQAPVLAANGALVGQVIDVQGRACTVLLVTDANSSVGALIGGHAGPPPVGICQGGRSGRLTVTDLRSDLPVQTGDPVQTSGLGGVYPRGLPVGTVTQVTVDKARSLKSAALRPAADLDHLEEAFVIL